MNSMERVFFSDVKSDRIEEAAVPRIKQNVKKN